MNPNRIRQLCAAAVSLVVFVVYRLTLSPATAMWDAGEYIAAAKSLGVPHQPGNPLAMIIARAFGLLPLSPEFDVRMNTLVAVTGALTAGLWFLVAERLLRERVPGERTRLLAAAGTALLGAGAFTVWNQSVVMEKVNPLALLGLAVTSWLALKWIDEAEGRASDRMLVLTTYVVGLTYAIHPAGLLAAPAVAAAVAMRRPKTLLRWKLIAVLAVAFFGGTSPFVALPIRAAYQPYINESAVSACENGKLELSCTFSKETARRLMGTINREQYGGNPVLARRGPFVAQVQMYWLYFKWQWWRDANNRFASGQSLVAAFMLVVGLFGLASIRESVPAATDNGPRSRNPKPNPWFSPAFAYFAVLTTCFTVALIYYLNFRYGFSQSPELTTVDREPRDRDYFYMWTFSLWGLLAGLGIVSFLKRAPALVLALAVLPFVANWKAASRTGQLFTRDWAADVLNSMEPNGIIITQGDNDSFPLWHAQAVNGIRPDVTIALVPYLGMEWYARQLNQRSPIWKLTNAELDTVPPAIEFAQPQSFRHGKIDAIIPPGWLTRDQLLVLHAIKDSFPARPIYFTFGGYPDPLGLAAYTKRVGLVQKLMPEPVKEDANTALIEGSYVDIKRSLELWNSYKGAQQLLREGRWLDNGSRGVPMYYAAIGQDLTRALVARGDTVQATNVYSTVRKIVAVLQE
jgi:hypothetical protein